MTVRHGYRADYEHPVGPFFIGDPGSDYDGFTWAQRETVTPIQKAAIRAGVITKPTICGITGAKSAGEPKSWGAYTFMHLENYANPLEFYPVSRAAHYALHSRFTDPLRWFRIVARNYVHGAWFTMLTMDPTDMVRPFAQVYPLGLPVEGALWTDVADGLGLSAISFPTSVAQAGLRGAPGVNLFR